MRLALPGNKSWEKPEWRWLDFLASDMQSIGAIGEDVYDGGALGEEQIAST